MGFRWTSLNDMAKLATLILFIVIGTALGAVPRKPRGVGAAKNLPGHPDPFILGGDIVEGRKYPGQVSIRLNGDHNCGGSILNQDYVLTAAHCSYRHSIIQLTVLSGTNNLKNGGTLHEVTEIHVHEDYNRADSWHNDVSVLKVEPPFEFAAGGVTAPVNLPVQDQDTPIGANATVIGWGRLSEGGEFPDDLYEVTIQIWDHDECNAAYQPDEHVYPEQICANTAEGNKGSCNGDSGGPLFVNNQVVGLVSWARGCDEKGYPTVYTRVSSYRSWIDHMANP
ncbi:mite allergen Eur m 3-like [Ischnura elegans]|uniref:mite allergen Eur m 3-like n=1 Tax=Ischnura elegans TaxID=197161 RepID=UPI001ED8BC54|nr:mite allergen Eur m 3-like [Ischnura elegans]